jgi:benzoyl-CoA 2,3-dioxygenase component A
MAAMDGNTLTGGLRRQHLIDPEVCIRCNTCEEVCPTHAISHDQVNYAVDFDRCDFCGNCLPPCPTGAIDNYRQVARAWTVAEQFGWPALPADAEPATPGASAALPAEVATITAVAAAGEGGRAVPPWSAAHPYVNLYAPERPVVATVAGNLRLTEPGTSSEIHHIVLDLGMTAFPLLEGQSVGVLPPGLDADGKPHRVRLYSIASPREGERPGKNNLALTVKRVTEDRAGRPVRGVCSNYLCDLEKGATVALIGPYGTSFLMPNHPGSHIVMICTGTGSAPMRAMTERRRRKWARGEGAVGKLLLYFGARTPGELPYFGPLMRLPKEFIDVQLAFSRDPTQPRHYVQDRMRAQAETLARLLADENAYFYLCGHKAMEDGVDAAFVDICFSAGRDWKQVKADLRLAGRYHVETY